jgi:hypothetical protein
MKKPTHIKIWPETIKYLPAIVHLPLDIKTDNIILDFSNCIKIDAAGLNILLMRLLKLKRSFGLQDSFWRINAPEPIIAILTSLGFTSYFKEILLKLPMDNMFDKKPIADILVNLSVPILQTEDVAVKLYSYPIYMFDFTDCDDRRELFNGFKKWLFNIFNDFKGYKIRKNEFTIILNEIFKNSADHTDDNASFAIDLRELTSHDKKNLLQICFSFTDFGKGIYRNIWDNIKEKHKLNRNTHEGISEAYHVATQMGFTTLRGNTKRNMGIGMSLITGGSKSINMELSVFDAKSRGLLTSLSNNTHSEIRRCFYQTNSNVNFCYFGQLNCEAIDDV